MLADSPVTCSFNNKCHRVTIIGAIGANLTKPVFTIASSTNQKDFRKFLKVLKDAVKEEYHCREKPILLVDNASAHTASVTKKELMLKFQTLF